jgi:uncharacterized protein YciI
MEYFVYGRDRVGASGLKGQLTEAHWGFMDGYAKELIARGPTLTGQDDEAESTGSLHIVDLADDEAAQVFAYEEPYYKGGAFESVLLCRFNKLHGTTMWEFADAVESYGRYLAITTEELEKPSSEHLILYGELLALDGQTPLGHAALLEAPSLEAAAARFPAGTQLHHWCFGGRR